MSCLQCLQRRIVTRKSTKPCDVCNHPHSPRIQACQPPPFADRLMSDPLLILGASTRAAASSAIRAGLSPLAADLFCDDDLRQMTDEVKRVSDYPSDLPHLARDFPPGPWMFTGGLENHPRIIDAISVERILWGTPAGPIQRVRDPWQLLQRFKHCGILCPEVLRGDQCDMIGRGSHGHWIRKPFRSAGGGNMELLSDCHTVSETPDSTSLPGDDAST